MLSEMYANATAALMVLKDKVNGKMFEVFLFAFIACCYSVGDD